MAAKSASKVQDNFGAQMQQDMFNLAEATIHSVCKGLIKRIRRLHRQVDGVIYVIEASLQHDRESSGSAPANDSRAGRLFIANAEKSQSNADRIAQQLSMVLHATRPTFEGGPNNMLLDGETDSAIRQFCRDTLRVKTLPQPLILWKADMNYLVGWMSRPKRREVLAIQNSYMDQIQGMIRAWWVSWMKLFDEQDFRGLADPELDVERLLTHMCNYLGRFFRLYNQLVSAFSGMVKLSDKLLTEKYAVDEEEHVRGSSSGQGNGADGIPHESKDALDRSAKLKNARTHNNADGIKKDKQRAYAEGKKFFADYAWTWLQVLSQQGPLNVQGRFFLYEFLYIGLSNPVDETELKILNQRYQDFVYAILKSMGKNAKWTKDYHMGIQRFREFRGFKDESLKNATDKLALDHLSLIEIPEGSEELKKAVTRFKNVLKDGNVSDVDRVSIYELLSIVSMSQDTPEQANKRRYLYALFMKKLMGSAALFSSNNDKDSPADNSEDVSNHHSKGQIAGVEDENTESGSAGRKSSEEISTEQQTDGEGDQKYQKLAQSFAIDSDGMIFLQIQGFKNGGSEDCTFEEISDTKIQMSMRRIHSFMQDGNASEDDRDYYNEIAEKYIVFQLTSCIRFHTGGLSKFTDIVNSGLSVIFTPKFEGYYSLKNRGEWLATYMELFDLNGLFKFLDEKQKQKIHVFMSGGQQSGTYLIDPWIYQLFEVIGMLAVLNGRREQPGLSEYGQGLYKDLVLGELKTLLLKPGSKHVDSVDNESARLLLKSDSKHVDSVDSESALNEASSVASETSEGTTRRRVATSNAEQKNAKQGSNDRRAQKYRPVTNSMKQLFDETNSVTAARRQIRSIPPYGRPSLASMDPFAPIHRTRARQQQGH